MSLILRAQIASAAQDVVSSWPLESFIAVNPLARHEARPFEAAAAAGVALTRPREAYLSDHARGRITDADLEDALLERIPELADDITIAGETVTAARVAACDLKSAAWELPATAERATPWLDDYLAEWLSSFVNPDPLWTMPHRQLGFFRAWRTLAPRDPALPRKARAALRAVPLQPEAALSWALDQLEVGSDTVTVALRDELSFLPGWVGHIKWRAEKVGDIDLFSYLAVRFVVRALQGIPVVHSVSPAITADAASSLAVRAESVAAQLSGAPAAPGDVASVSRVLASHPVVEHPFTWQKAFELHYRRALLGCVLSSSVTSSSVTSAGEHESTPAMQVLMCIDTRSEGMRRHLEQDATVETFGIAGFFGVPVRFARFGARGAVNSLPALLAPRHQITELPADSADATRIVSNRRGRDALGQAAHSADSSTATPFAFAEAIGWFYGALSLLRTYTPTLHARIRRGLAPAAGSLESSVTLADAFTLDERASMAETAVRMMGMTRFAPLVVVAGHGSESVNNLYESVLDCGACGGNPGAANARAAAAMFNDTEVRALLATRGIAIPATTYFVAAEHNTVSDAVELIDRHLIPTSHAAAARQFEELNRATADALVRERAADLPGASPRQSPSRMRRRAHDWAEIYPEFGLARNAAMIIGPRQLTRGVDLSRRVFLHSYETKLDPDGSALESIMTAPLVVAQWINAQYYFSATNPATLGAGTKTIHNAIGSVGVLAGRSGDLRRGLPWQSVGVGTELFHEPMRLTVVIEAPLQRVGDIVSRNQVLRNLLDNDWISLTARTDPGVPWHRYTPYGWKAEPTTTKGS